LSIGSVSVSMTIPGVVVTPLQRTGGMTEEEYAQFLEHSKESHALGRPGSVDEVARAIAFLASSAASFTTGDLLTVDGGRAVMCPR
uniref:SDR family oxidoreductase n=1 Tax=Echinostoma caproni TaxID=27848 RepID=A0A183ACM8_9TREM